MAVIIRIIERNTPSTFIKLPNILYCSSSATKQLADNAKSEVGEFRVFELIPKKPERRTDRRVKYEVLPPRCKQMPTDQDWPSVWPGPRSFHPAVVPLPIRQGYTKKNRAPPNKWGNAELMKIPNFLHLTPPAIRRHCEALKQFCTAWPAGLETEEKCNKYFPITYISSDYCYASPTIRDPLSRIVSIKLKLSSLKLNRHAKDKFLRLVKHRYDNSTDIVTIVADRCPTRKQNRDYADYLLTAVFHESWRVESWEDMKQLVDMEYYDWDRNRSRDSLVRINAWPKDPPEDMDYEDIPHVTEYKIAVSELMNTGEDNFTVNKYTEAVKKLLHLKRDAVGN